MLNTVSRRRSLVGRSAGPASERRRRERNLPAMTRTLGHPRETVAALPLGRQEAQGLAQLLAAGLVLGQRPGLAAGVLEKFPVAQRVRHLEAHFARLPGAEELAGAAQRQVGLGDLEAVRGAH